MIHNECEWARIIYSWDWVGDCVVGIWNFGGKGDLAMRVCRQEYGGKSMDLRSAISTKMVDLSRSSFVLCSCT